MAAEDYSNNLSTALVPNCDPNIKIFSKNHLIWFSKENRTLEYKEKLVQKFQDSTR